MAESNTLTPNKTHVSAQVVSTSSAENTTPSETINTPPKPSRRPSILNRTSADKQASGDNTPVKGSRRNSWISNLSSKFSSQPQSSPTAPQTSKPSVNGINAGPPAQSAKDHLPVTTRTHDKAAEELEPYVPQKPKEANSSFFSNLTRRLSSNQQAGGLGKVAETGGVCPRRILNVDRYRERCLVPELDLAKLKRVSFSVDVEIAGGPRYKDDDSASTKQRKTRDRKVQARAEGEALKHPEAVTEQKEKSDTIDGKTDDAVAGSEVPLSPVPSVDPALASNGVDDTPKKTQPTEEERIEKKERKRRRAEESGHMLVEVMTDAASTVASSVISTPPVSGATTPKAQDRPTTDPVRIYRRCCQLRESPILKRITEQLMSPNCTMAENPGVVTELRLSGSRMQLADVLTLSDWLAIVPVKRLLLEDADLSDEGVRVILAGLLAAKKPEPTKHRSGSSRQSKNAPVGIIEKLTLKNNPRITKVGWKYIALFLYMCRSIKAVDVSMIKFPQAIPPASPETEVKPPGGRMRTTGRQVDAAETMCKALSERLGGSTLEELTMAECGLSSVQIRKIVDGAIVSGISRLGFAGNRIDDDAFDNLLHYVRSGVCHALDLGSNDLRGKLGRLGETIAHSPDIPLWGLSLAGCNLDTESLKQLFPSLTALRDFRFLDLSHNEKLFDSEVPALQLLRKYLPKLQSLKRLHLRDVGLNVKQAISLAEVLPEGPSLAHLTILENPQIVALTTSNDERSQEEACALYASLTAAARISKSIVCIDIDVSFHHIPARMTGLTNQHCLGAFSRTRRGCQGPCQAGRGILSPEHGSYHVHHTYYATRGFALQASWCRGCSTCSRTRCPATSCGKSRQRSEHSGRWRTSSRRGLHCWGQWSRQGFAVLPVRRSD